MALKPLRVLLTSCGCPGASTLIRMLKQAAWDEGRELAVIGMDCDHEAIGRFLADSFHQVPPYSDAEAYMEAVRDILRQEKPDVILPENATEAYLLSVHATELERLGATPLVSSPQAISTCENKYLLYSVLKDKKGVKPPRFCWPQSLDEFEAEARELGWPDKPICFKPHEAKGSRGFRIVDERVSRREQLLERKPNARYMGMDEFIAIFKDEPDFPKLLLMEYVEGQEVTTDCLCLDGEALLTTAKTVEQARWGVIVRGELVFRPDLVDQTEAILRAVPLSYCVNLQFVGDKLIEINPRVSSFIYQSEFCQPYLAIKLALGEIVSPEMVKSYRSEIAYGRRMVRYMDQVFYDGAVLDAT